MTAMAPASVPLTISTLPGGAALDESAAARLAEGGGLLYDVVYGHWPTALATAWQQAGGHAVDGRGMLLRQAVLQIRAFATGAVTEPLPDEEAVVEHADRSAVAGTAGGGHLTSLRTTTITATTPATPPSLMMLIALLITTEP